MSVRAYKAKLNEVMERYPFKGGSKSLTSTKDQMLYDLLKRSSTLSDSANPKELAWLKGAILGVQTVGIWNAETAQNLLNSLEE